MKNEAESLKLTLRDAHDTLREEVGNDPTEDANGALDDMQEIVTWLGQLAKVMPDLKLLNHQMHQLDGFVTNNPLRLQQTSAAPAAKKSKPRNGAGEIFIRPQPNSRV